MKTIKDIKLDLEKFKTKCCNRSYYHKNKKQFCSICDADVSNDILNIYKDNIQIAANEINFNVLYNKTYILNEEII